ncbi:MAG: hypothetical protein ACKVXR_17360 [Planctomycetota bacterium]
MKSLRLWIVLLAVVCFVAGTAAGALATAASLRTPPEGGPFAAYERDLVATFSLSDERARLLRALLLGYERDIERIKAGRMAETMSAMEPELAARGRWYHEQIRDKVLPPGRQAEFDGPAFVSTWSPAR